MAIIKKFNKALDNIGGMTTNKGSSDAGSFDEGKQRPMLQELKTPSSPKAVGMVLIDEDNVDRSMHDKSLDAELLDLKEADSNPLVKSRSDESDAKSFNTEKFSQSVHSAVYGDISKGSKASLQDGEANKDVVTA